MGKGVATNAYITVCSYTMSLADAWHAAIREQLHRRRTELATRA
jgi:hypothetical protein